MRPLRQQPASVVHVSSTQPSQKPSAAAEQMAGNPAALELRRMQMIAEVGAENNSTTVLLIPSDFVTLAKSLAEYLRDHQRR